MKPYGIHWFRRDLRVEGNPALTYNLQKNGGHVLGLFVFDPKFLARPDFSPNRFAFFLNTLAELKATMQKLGGDLLVLDQGPDEAFESLLKTLQKDLPSLVSLNRDYEPFARTRDARLEQLIRSYSVSVHTARDHLLIEPHEIVKSPQNGWYQVFSPFQKKWLEKFATEEVQDRVHQSFSRAPQKFKISWKDLPLGKKHGDCLESYRKKVVGAATVPLPPAGHAAAVKAMDTFGHHHLRGYENARDIPSIPGTSRLSYYLKNGSITVPQVIHHLKLSSKHGKYLSELIWREFYYHILFHRPDVEKRAFLEKYRDIPWEDDKEKFNAWCEGKTGYPIVDAAMRELNTTGWMHNRMRMVVASFLCKDLLINWQWGERYFMEKLLDGDLAPNNGGWQWAASTGCDPQPYFRVFNPTLQGKRYDPEGVYVKRFVPELRNFDSKTIHEPWKEPLLSRAAGYPDPTVDHSVQSKRAIALYQRASLTPPSARAET